MSRGLPRLLIALVLLCLGHDVAAAQTGGATAPLSGVVTDQNDAVVPGVTVVVKNNATGVSLPPVTTNHAGLFSVAALDPGTYIVTFSLSGFKTAVVRDVQIVTATPADLKVTLEAGPVTETVAVHARTPVVQTQSTAVSSTLYSDQIRNLPLNTKNAVNFVTLLPGVDTGTNHNPNLSTFITGLPGSANLISIDGIQTQHPLSKSADPFYSYIWPSVDAIEQVTVSIATPGADASGQGAAQIRFTTRSGTDRYSGAFFETLRHPVMNANTFFNKVNGVPLNRIVLNQYGGNVGGPVVLPGLDLRRTAFFFANYEEMRQSSELSRDRTLLSPAALTGLFSYTSANGVRQVNVLELAAANGQLADADPTITRLLAELTASTRTTGSTSPNADTNTIGYSWNSPDDLLRRQSTNRVDIALHPAHRLSAIYNFNKYQRRPDTLTMRDPRFPGLPNFGSNTAYRNSATGTLRSTVSPNLVNEVTSGAFWATNNQSPELSPSVFANQGGYTLALAGGSVFAGLSPATAGGATEANGNGNHSASAPVSLWSLADKISWQRGRHSLQLGGELTYVKGRRRDQQTVPALTFGVVAGDPANALFTTTTLPGASDASLTDAKFLYALLTGRVASITTEMGLDPVSNQYVVNGPTDRRSHQHEIGLFVQDSFRVAPNLTLNVGLRYELQLPLEADLNVWSANTIADACGVSGMGQGPGGRPCNIFMPGTLTGVTPVYTEYKAGTRRYETDWNNLAPSVGVAWLPGVETGALRALLGDPDQATVRAAYARAFIRDGLMRFGQPYEANPGPSFDAVRSVANGNLGNPPLLLREPGRLGPGDFPQTPIYPLAINRASGVNLFDPDWQVGYADSFSVGIQRALSRDTAVEVRYVGTRGRNLVELENWNEINLVENGFLDEFKAAQANLYANIAAGRGQTFAYAGQGTGTSPLPTYLAYFNGSTNASDPLAYTGNRWTDAQTLGRLASLNPNPTLSAGDLHGNAAFRTNALRAGVPANFFVLNPDVTPVNVHVSKGSTRYDALQVELRHRLSRGLALTASYAYTKARTSRLDSLRVNRALVPSLNAVPHSLKFATSYDVPFGRDRRFGADAAGWLEALAGNWSVNMTGKVTSGSILNFGNVRMYGMTIDELQRAIEYRIVPGSVNADGTTTPARVYNLPEDIIDNTIKAFSVNVNGYTAGTPTGRYFAPANGPDCIQVLRGDCAPKDIIVVAPPFTRFDFGARKRIALTQKVNLVVEIDVLNLFNAINFNPVALPVNPTNRDAYRVTTSYQDINQASDPGSRAGQLVFRFNW
jgi:hypothetical protein